MFGQEAVAEIRRDIRVRNPENALIAEQALGMDRETRPAAKLHPPFMRLGHEVRTGL